MVHANRKMGQKGGGQKGPKMAIFALFRPFVDVFQSAWISSRTLKSRAPCVEPWSSRKKIGVGALRYEGSKSGIFEAFPETPRTTVWVALPGQVYFPFPNTVLTIFFGDFWVRCHHAEPPAKIGRAHV